MHHSALSQHEAYETLRKKTYVFAINEALFFFLFQVFQFKTLVFLDVSLFFTYIIYSSYILTHSVRKTPILQTDTHQIPKSKPSIQTVTPNSKHKYLQVKSTFRHFYLQAGHLKWNNVRNDLANWMNEKFQNGELLWHEDISSCSLLSLLRALPHLAFLAHVQFVWMLFYYGISSHM